MTRQIAGFEKVRQDDFYRYVGPRDIVVYQRGRNPIWRNGWSSFQTRQGREVGRVYDAAASHSEYFLLNELRTKQ
ncbi:hypothetical protein ABN148_20925 [Klebsiella oxytoca]|uniref:hypothetical protein n=1 Tax=Klebsiella oxytoca TaxID=571 RepID=UPI0018AB49BD|nr:hypothetical protein [Klebsiella oxytoca]MBF8468530.1 hypothetical protein [Klebsiella oxytoca]MBZ7699776.1 hypothetical protein [Klebsiella oxytoca]